MRTSSKTYKYDAFGVEKDISDSDTNAFRYCGEYYDKETATVYLRARYYNPGTGRFISRDSFAGRRSDPLSLNLYTYCRNNPIRFIDPSGHSYAEYTDENGKTQRMPINGPGDIDVLERRRSEAALSDSKTSENSVTSKKGAPGCGHDSFTPGCAAHDGVVVVAREGKTNDENKRFNATITVLFTRWNRNIFCWKYFA